MKTVKMILVMSIILIVSASSATFAQMTRQESKQLKSLDKEIKKLDFQTNRLEMKINAKGYVPIDYIGEVKILKAKIDSLTQFQPKSVLEMSRRDSLVALWSGMINYDNKQLSKQPDTRALVQELNWKWERMNKLQKERDKIFDRYSTATSVPKELNNHTAHLRDNGFHVRTRELLVNKIENNLSAPISVDSTKAKSNGMVTKDGYKVIFHNLYCSQVVFKIYSADGVSSSYCLKSGQKEIHYLLPGTYSIHYIADGAEICEPRNMNIDGQLDSYEGEQCFNFVYMPYNVRR